MFKYIIYFFDLKLSDNVLPIYELSFHNALICLVVLLCFINVFGYLISMHLIKFYNVKTKYPKLKLLIDYFIKSSWVFLILEVIIGFGGLISLIFLGFLPFFFLILWVIVY